MAASITDVVKIGTRAWKYYFSGTADFTVVKDGGIAYQGESTTFVAEWKDATAAIGEEAPPIEAIDSTETTAALKQILYPPNLLLQFRGRATNSYYLIEYSIDGGANWAAGIKQREDGSGYYQVNTSTLPQIDILFRITPYDSEGQAGVPVEYSIFQYSAPDPPSLQFGYNPTTHYVTVDAL